MQHTDGGLKQSADIPPSDRQVQERQNCEKPAKGLSAYPTRNVSLLTRPVTKPTKVTIVEWTAALKSLCIPHTHNKEIATVL
jgi:hypothetical protein